MFEAAVEISREWDAYTAGQEVVASILKQLNGEPTFMLVYASTHYKKNGGFQKILDAIYKKIPSTTPITGGTVTGFLCSKGCFTRGVAVFAVRSDEIQVNTSCAHGVRRNPVRTAEKCAENLEKNVDLKSFQNRLLINIEPGPTMPVVPGMKHPLIVAKSGILAKLAPKLLILSTILLNKGMGRENELLDTFGNRIKNGLVVGGSSSDDNKYSDNYQFYFNKVFDDAFVVLDCTTNLNIITKAASAVRSPTEWFNISKASGLRHVIVKIAEKSALDIYTKAYRLKSDIVFEVRNVHRCFVFAPLVTIDKFGVQHARVPGTFYGKTIGVGHQIQTNSIGFASTSAADMIKTVEKVFDEENIRNSKSYVMFSCAVMLETLGDKVYNVFEKIQKQTNGKPYLLVFSGGENYRTSETLTISTSVHLTELSLTMAGIG